MLELGHYPSCSVKDINDGAIVIPPLEEESGRCFCPAFHKVAFSGKVNDFFRRRRGHGGTTWILWARLLLVEKDFLSHYYVLLQCILPLPLACRRMFHAAWEIGVYAEEGRKGGEEEKEVQRFLSSNSITQLPS